MSEKELELDVHEGQNLLQKNVQIENEKQSSENENASFDIKSKRNLIHVAKETLKPKKHINKYLNNPLSPNKKCDINKILNQKKLMNKNYLSSDKQYLNFVLNEYKSISTTMISQQKKLNPSLNIIINNNISNKYLNRNSKLKNLYTDNIGIKKNCKEINLLDQICGSKDEKENYQITERTNENQDKDKFSIFFTQATDSDRISVKEVKKDNAKNAFTEKKEERKNEANFNSVKKNKNNKKKNREIDISFENYANVYDRKIVPPNLINYKRK